MDIKNVIVQMKCFLELAKTLDQEELIMPISVVKDWLEVLENLEDEGE